MNVNKTVAYACYVIVFFFIIYYIVLEANAYLGNGIERKNTESQSLLKNSDQLQYCEEWNYNSPMY